MSGPTDPHRASVPFTWIFHLSRSKSSARWLQRHFTDPYVKQAQARGLVSRAAIKLEEIEARDRFLRAGMQVIDLGAAPGGWSQVAVERVGPTGRVIALDLLPLEVSQGITFIQGDFREPTIVEQLLAILGETRVDVVLSDMAPNLSGVEAVDQPRAIHLAELAFELAQQVLLVGEGALLIKIFQGVGFDEFLLALRRGFRKVVVRKPKASRPESREVYLLARNRIL